MKHRIGYNRIGRKASHRKALVRNMVTQLYRHERIRTTKAKALEVRRRAEKLITRAKEDSVHNRRIVAKLIQDKEILAKLFTEIAPGFIDRAGGYTRILKLGYRKGDAAEMVLLELVGREEESAPRRRRAKPPVKEKAPPETVEEGNLEVDAPETTAEPDENAELVDSEAAVEEKKAEPEVDEAVGAESDESDDSDAVVDEEKAEPEADEAGETETDKA